MLALLAGAVAALALRSSDSLGRDIARFTAIVGHREEATHLPSFTLSDPYDGPGEYRKAQLHVHTSNSADVREKIPVAETIRRYKRAGCSFVVVTDHDRLTDVTGLSEPGLAVLQGVEETIPAPVWPLGRHLLRLGTGLGFRELRAPAHPSWGGNLGTGRWGFADLRGRSDLRLFEIYNGRSNSRLDIWLWQELLARRGPDNPVWGIAVDDADNAVAIDAGWVMVKTPEVSPEALLEALDRGRFYATNGALAEFGAADGAIGVSTAPGSTIRFFDRFGEVQAVARGAAAEYRPVGDEGFVRVEVLNPAGRIAWSQPFFLIPAEDQPSGEPGAGGENVG